MGNQQSLVDADYVKQAQETLQQAWGSIQEVLDASLQQIQETNRELAALHAQSKQLQQETERLEHDLGQMQAQLDEEKQSAQSKREFAGRAVEAIRKRTRGKSGDLKNAGAKNTQIAQFEQQLRLLRRSQRSGKALEARKVVERY